MRYLGCFFVKTRRGQSPPGWNFIHAETRTHGSAQRTLSLRLSCVAVNCRKSTDRPDVEIRISSRFTARSLCRNRGPCWSARPPSLRCALRFGLLFSRFSVPPSLRGLSSHHPISCRRVLPAPKGLRLPSSYLLGLPPSGSSFRWAVAAPCSPSPRVVKR